MKKDTKEPRCGLNWVYQKKNLIKKEVCNNSSTNMSIWLK